MSIELTAEKAMELAIAKAKESRKKAKNEAKLALINNEDYVGYLAEVQEEEEQVTALTNLLETVNKMKPIVTTDGTKYSVHCYPVAEYLFGPVAGRVLGLITGSSAMFTDERQAEFKALTGVSHLVMSKARDAIGSPAYFNKGVYSTQIEGNGDCRKSAILAILQGLNVDIEYVKQFSDSKIAKWFQVSDEKAKAKRDEFNKNEAVDSTNNFVLED